MPSAREVVEMNWFAVLTAEFLGTFILVFTVANAIMSGSFLASFAIACSLMVVVYALGPVSGGNFNPAVTFGLLLAYMAKGHGDMPIPRLLGYWAVQFVGAFLAAIASGAVWGTPAGGAASTYNNSPQIITGNLTLSSVSGGFPGLGPGDHCEGSAYLAEFLFTCMLVFVVLNVGTLVPEKENNYFGIAIGFVINAAATAISHVSGCSLNPAVSCGLAMGSALFGSMPLSTALYNFALYSLFELFGAAFAVFLFFVVRAEWFSYTSKPVSMRAKMAAEFIGSFYLVLQISLVASDTGARFPGPLGLLGTASALMSMVYSLGAVSGAHLNPAVSLGMLIRGEFDDGLKGFIAYALSQFFGALAGVGMTSVIELCDSRGGYSIALVASSEADTADAGLIVLAKGTWGAIVGGEFVYTFLLVLVVLNTAVAPDAPNHYFGLAIGFVIVAGGVSVGPLTGGCFNPAVAFALGLGGCWATAEGGNNGWFLVYMVIEFVAGVAAAGVTHILRPEDEGWEGLPQVGDGEDLGEYTD